MYISLPSDASLKYFPNNIISNYTVKLPGELNYDREKYEVGLVSCNWTKSFHNIETTELKVYDLTDEERTPKITTLPGKYYEDVQELLDEINKRINALIAEEDSFVSSDQNALVFKINEFGKVYFEQLDDTYQYGVVSSASLLEKLGFPPAWEHPSGINGVKHGVTAERFPDLNAGLNSIYVYCSIMEPSRIVGDDLWPVLRILPVVGSTGNTIHYQPNNIEYFPLRLDHFSEISIELRDEIGVLVPFNFGKIVIDIHIKRKFL